MNKTRHDDEGRIFMTVKVDGVEQERECEIVIHKSSSLGMSTFMGSVNAPSSLRPILRRGEELVEFVGGDCEIVTTHR